LASEPVPGKTNFTRDSELMNAETSAWGRALIAVGAADAKRGIASANEVRNRQQAVDLSAFDEAVAVAQGVGLEVDWSKARGFAARSQANADRATADLVDRVAKHRPADG